MGLELEIGIERIPNRMNQNRTQMQKTENNYRTVEPFYLSISDKGNKATNMPLNDTIYKHYTIKTKIDICIIKTRL